MLRTVLNYKNLLLLFEIGNKFAVFCIYNYLCRVHTTLKNIPKNTIYSTFLLTYFILGSHIYIFNYIKNTIKVSVTFDGYYLFN